MLPLATCSPPETTGMPSGPTATPLPVWSGTVWVQMTAPAGESFRLKACEAKNAPFGWMFPVE